MYLHFACKRFVRPSILRKNSLIFCNMLFPKYKSLMLFAKTSVFYTSLQSYKVGHLQSCFGLSHNFWNMLFFTWIYLFLMSNPKTFTFVRENLYEIFRKNFTLRGHVFFFLTFVLQSPLYCNGYLQLGKFIIYDI